MLLADTDVLQLGIQIPAAGTQVLTDYRLCRNTRRPIQVRNAALEWKLGYAQL